MKSLNRDFLLIVICLIAILMSSYLLYQELIEKIYRSDEDAIGLLIIKKRIAERKYAEHAVWESLSNNTPFFNYDSVRTVVDSAASFQFNEGGEVAIDEETMIIIISEKNKNIINFDRGSISIKNDSSKTMVFNTKDFSISMGKGEFTAKKTGDAIDINVLSGEVTINKGGELTKISANVTAHITDDGITQKVWSIIPEFPANNKYFVTYKNRDKINFKWSSKFLSDEKIQVAADSDFEKIKYSGVTNSKSYSFDIAPGDYYWRVVSSKDVSHSRKFTILLDKQPEIISPDLSDVVEIIEDEMIKFKWSKSDLVLNYEFYLSQDQGSQNFNNYIGCEINSANIYNIKSGRTIWNVVYNYPDSFMVLFEPKIMGVFDVKIVPVTHAKPRLFVENDMKVSKFADDIIFRWEGCRGAKGYKVDISADKDFKEILHSSAANLTLYNADMLPEGGYFFRVSAIYDDNVITTSDILNFGVISPPPVIYLYPANGSTISDLSNTLDFLWNDVTNAWNYLFEVSSDSDFKNIIHSIKTGKMYAQIKKPSKGDFYWRVSILGKSGEPVVSGEAAYFAIEDSIAKIALIYPRNMNVVNLDDVDSIDFQWSSVKEADSYEVEFFQKIEGRNRSIFFTKSKRTDLSVSNFSIFRPGRIEWLVRATKTNGGRLITVNESERTPFIIKVSENISAPKVEAPEVIYVK